MTYFQAKIKRLIYLSSLGENTFKTVPNKGSYLGKGEIMILILCEKPSQARNYASAMGGSLDSRDVIKSLESKGFPSM